MASPQASEKFTFNNKVKMYDFDEDATTAAEATRVDMKDYGEFTVTAMASALTGAGITKLEIVAAAASSGGTLYVIKDSGTVAADAVGDQVTESCSAKEIAQIGTDNGVDLRYVSARLTQANAADESVLTYIRSQPRFATTGLTPDTDIS